MAFESPERLPRSLERLARLDPERRIAVCRELTKRFEEVVRGAAAEVGARFPEPTKGEATIVIGHCNPGKTRMPTLPIEAVRRLVEGGAPRRPAADVVSGLVRTPRNELYRASLDSAD